MRVINSHKIRSLDTNLLSKVIKQKKLKKKIRIFFFKFFWFFFSIIIVLLNVRRPGRKTSGFLTARTLKICRTSEPDVMSGRALYPIVIFWEENQFQNDLIAFWCKNICTLRIKRRNEQKGSRPFLGTFDISSTSHRYWANFST